MNPSTFLVGMAIPPLPDTSSQFGEYDQCQNFEFTYVIQTCWNNLNLILLWVPPLSGIHIEHFDFDPLSPWTTTCFKRIICCFPLFQDVQLAVDKILSAHEVAIRKNPGSRWDLSRILESI